MNMRSKAIAAHIAARDDFTHDPLLAVRANLQAAFIAEADADEDAPRNSPAELYHRTRGAAFRKALDMVQTHIEASPTVTIPMPIHRPDWQLILWIVCAFAVGGASVGVALSMKGWM